MKASDIQRALMVKRYRRSFVLNNYTPIDWWECDVFEITDAGYFREYEIKLSVSDFKADSKKEKRGWEYNPDTRVVTQPRIGGKHEMLASGDTRGPSAFSFVTPEGLIEGGSIPEWAGLITAHWIPSHSAPWNVRLTIVRPPRRLHAQKIATQIEQHAKGVCYYRMHNLFCFGKSTSLVDQPEELKIPNTLAHVGEAELSLQNGNNLPSPMENSSTR